MRPLSTPHFLLLPVAASIGLSLFPWCMYVLYPFKLFTTWIHECSHAMAAVAVGGKVHKITLSADTSGLTHYQIPNSRWRQAVVASSGYLGASAAGCALYAFCLSHYARQAHTFELALGVCLWLTGVLWVRNWFGALAVALLGGGLIAFGRLGYTPYGETLLAFLAVQTALNAVLDIRTLFGLSRASNSDAHTMQSILYLPAGLWAFLWLSLTCLMSYWTLRLTG